MSETVEKISVAIDKDLYNDIKDYCRLNGMKISDYINNHLRADLTDDKWGDAPFLPKKKTMEEEPIVPDIIREHALKTLYEQNKKPIKPVVTESGEIDLGISMFEGQGEYFIPEREETKQEILPEKEEIKPKRRKLK